MGMAEDVVTPAEEDDGDVRLDGELANESKDGAAFCMGDPEGRKTGRETPRSRDLRRWRSARP